MQIHPPGTRIGPYEIVSHPLMGELSAVYFGIDHAGQEQPVALKAIKAGLPSDPAARGRFLHENAWVDLGAHPHIVRCYAVQYIDPIAFLALELIAREQGRSDASLRSWLGAPMPPEQALLFALQIGRGMAHATRMIPGFVHRDLKPENVLVGADKLPGTEFNQLHVTDFGLIESLQDEEEAQGEEGSPEAPGRTHLRRGMRGTPLYMAPEQWKENPLGVYTDVYALGCVLYEMLSGQTAARGEKVRHLRAAHCSGDLQPLPENLPEPLKALLRQCLALLPQERLQEWETLNAALEQCYAALSGVEAPPEMSTDEMGSEERKKTGWVYNELGSACAKTGRLDAAVGYFEKAAALGRESGDREGEGSALANLGLANANLGRAQQATAFCKQGLELLRAGGNRRAQGMALDALGSTLAVLGEARQAIGFHEQALAIARENGDRQLEGAILNNLGEACRKLGQMQKADSYYKQALAILHEGGDRRQESAALNNLGIVTQQLGNPRQANTYFERALELARSSGDLRAEGNALGSLGNLFFGLGRAEEAVGYYKQQLEITRRSADRKGEGNALGNLGSACLALNKAQQAIECQEQSLEIARETGNREGEGNALGNLGNAYLSQNDPQRALGYYEPQLEIARAIGDRTGEGNCLNNLGLARANLGEFQQAGGYYEQALVLARQVGNPNGIANVLYNMALLHANQGQTTRALAQALEAARLWKQTGNSNAQSAEQLVNILQSSGLPAGGDQARAALEAFQQTASLQAMQVIVGQYPFMTEVGFIQALEQLMERKVAPEHRPVFEQQLAWLKVLAGK